MDLSEATRDGSSGEATRVDRRDHTADEATLMPNDIPNAAAKLAETYHVEATAVDESRNGASGLARLRGRVD